jgi:hypothetical protein
MKLSHHWQKWKQKASHPIDLPSFIPCIAKGQEFQAFVTVVLYAEHSRNGRAV